MLRLVFLLFVGFFWLSSAPLAKGQVTNADLEIKINQVYFSGDQLDFDIVLRSLNGQRHFLGFTDVVLAFELGALADTASIRLWPGSSQLLSGELQLLSNYETRYNFKFDRTGPRILVYIGVDPPRFKTLSDFVASIAHIDDRSDFHRLGRFTITGIQQVPDVLQLHVSNKGLHTQAYKFLPEQNFFAAQVSLELPPLALMKQSLEMFEAERVDDRVNIRWQAGELSQWKNVSLERSYDLNTWEEAQFLGVSSRDVTDVPEPPVFLEGNPIVYYRLLITPQKGKAFYGPIRSVQF